MEKIIVSIVEDNHEIREGLCLILNSTDGFACTGTFSNAEDAIIGIPSAPPDVILMDINLPGLSGIDAIKKIKQINSSIRFMMFTIYEEDEKIFESLRSGATGYILKKTQPANILQAIRELYDGGSPMSTQIARKVVSFFQGETKGKKLPNPLSVREEQVLELLSKGHLYKEISEILFISIGTVKQHIHNIYEKLQVQNKTEAINKFYHSK